MVELIRAGLLFGTDRRVLFVGNMYVRRIADAIELFSRDRRVSVMLISTKAGAEGLNLPAADHVFLVDPWCNPATEEQACQRGPAGESVW